MTDKTGTVDLASSLASVRGVARAHGLPDPDPAHVSLQSWALNGKHLGEKRNARTNPAGTFVELRVVTADGTEWSTFKRGERCEGEALEAAKEAGYR